MREERESAADPSKKNAKSSRGRGGGFGGSSSSSSARLRQTKALLAREVERSSATLGVVADSARVTRDALYAQHALGGHISASSTLVGRIRAAATRERIALLASAAFFLLCVLYVLWCRI